MIFFSNLLHRLKGYTKLKCPACNNDWAQWDGVNPIHADGPPFWFDVHCTNCHYKHKSLSSGLLERAASKAHADGVSEDQILRVLHRVLPDHVIQDTLKEYTK